MSLVFSNKLFTKNQGEAWIPYWLPPYQEGYPIHNNLQTFFLQTDREIDAGETIEPHHKNNLPKPPNPTDGVHSWTEPSKPIDPPEMESTSKPIEDIVTINPIPQFQVLPETSMFRIPDSTITT